MIQYGLVMRKGLELAPVHWYDKRQTDGREHDFGWIVLGWFLRDTENPDGDMPFEPVDGLRVS